MIHANPRIGVAILIFSSESATGFHHYSLLQNSFLLQQSVCLATAPSTACICQAAVSELNHTIGDSIFFDWMAEQKVLTPHI